jgi:hypothetical protein
MKIPTNMRIDPATTAIVNPTALFGLNPSFPKSRGFGQ